ncbi:MAG: DUF5947 family protein, partial [Candidatus Rokuibacteriota bacterium]
AQVRPRVERCELCAMELAAVHDHLLEAERRQLRCACGACSRLLDEGRWTLVRHRVQRLADVRLTDDEWQSLGLPIDLAFFVWSSAAGRALALYPSPGGLVESDVALPAWDGLVAAHPALGSLRPDVEALLARRTGSRRDHYLVSVDECYRLVGLMRLHWRGFAGGPEVEARIEDFFAELDRMDRAR